jgi:DNA invertase Pin-like site-specific DNA recombinase
VRRRTAAAGSQRRKQCRENYVAELGRKPKLNARQAATVRRMYHATGPDGKRQHTVAEIAEAVGVHRTTVYDYFNKEH